MASYRTHFTVSKSQDGVRLATHSGSLLSYDDYLITPSVSPTEIACDQ